MGCEGHGRCHNSAIAGEDGGEWSFLKVFIVQAWAVVLALLRMLAELVDSLQQHFTVKITQAMLLCSWKT
jgi:hypothetical protein